MNIKTGAGRPQKSRNLAAGKNLYLALKILGKSWRKNSEDHDHVLKWDSWIANGLPRSTTTIDADIRQGIPEDRLLAYAKCLGLSPQALQSPDADMHATLDAARQFQADSAPVDFGYGSGFQEKYLEYNSPKYIEELFRLLRGVYIVNYITPSMNNILRCSFYISSAERHIIRGRGLFVIFGLNNFVTANIFRWHNNLHSLFHCQNMMEFGHYLVIDPLRHHLVSRRAPFWLKGQGVTDSGQAGNLPIPFTFRMQKLAAPPAVSLEAFWEQECKALQSRPVIIPDDAEYASVRRELEEPEAY